MGPIPVPSFEEVWSFTQKISSETAFSKEASEAFYECLVSLPERIRIVEVGCEFGRSTSILAQLAKARGDELFLIDPFLTHEGFAGLECMKMLLHVRPSFVLYCKRTIDVDSKLLPFPVDFLHIDGDHSYEALTIDCQTLLPRVGLGGLVCFHDYDRDSLPDVKCVVDKFVEGDSCFETIGTYDTLHVIRRICLP